MKIFAIRDEAANVQKDLAYLLYYELLMLAMGRCAQDDQYLVPIEEKELPGEIKKRFATRIEDVLPLDDYCLLVFFRDGMIKKCDLKKHFEKTKGFQILLKKPEYFEHVQMQIGGYGVAWDVNMSVSDSVLYRMGKTVPLTAADFRNFVTHRVINATEAAELLGCSRQNIIDLTKRGKLHPLKTSDKNTLYLKSEILKRNWQQDNDKNFVWQSENFCWTEFFALQESASYKAKNTP